MKCIKLQDNTKKFNKLKQANEDEVLFTVKDILRFIFYDQERVED